MRDGKPNHERWRDSQTLTFELSDLRIEHLLIDGPQLIGRIFDKLVGLALSLASRFWLLDLFDILFAFDPLCRDLPSVLGVLGVHSLLWLILFTFLFILTEGPMSA